MQQLFISSKPSLLRNWSEAFSEEATLLPTNVKGGLAGSVTYWLDWDSIPEKQAQSIFQSLVDSSSNAVVMSNKPSAENAMSYFTRGARGYCHTYAAAKQLKEISLVLEHGGIWLGSDAMQRLLHGTLPLFKTGPAGKATQDLLESLTTKERAVAKEVARGASNREIADTLSASERTVKAHLSVIFEKCHVRDRVQLALLLNNIPVR